MEETPILSVVKGRFSGDNEYYPLEEPTPPPPPDFTEEQLREMPQSLRPAANSVMRQHEARKELYQRELKALESIRYCIEKNDGKLAYRILQSRRGYEDEDFEIVTVDEVY